MISYGLFLAKTITLIVAFAVIGGLIARILRAVRRHPGGRGHLEVQHINSRLRETADMLLDEMLEGDDRKKHIRQIRRTNKKRRREMRHGDPRLRLFVLDFAGDLDASATSALREEVSAILQIAQPTDEVLVRLESTGGFVHSYGLAASQLRRLREHGLHLIVAVDKVAASGGYLMACVADQIIAAPFAVIGSIGVVAQLPNFYRWLKKNDIDIELHTAGEFKRTLTMFGENSEAARNKFLAELEETHALFKAFVSENRPQVAIGDVSTGEHWYGSRALEIRLVDHLKTSDDYLLEQAKIREVFVLRYRCAKTLRERLMSQLGTLRLQRGLSPL